MTGRLTGKIALITGVGGMGAAAAARFAAAVLLGCTAGMTGSLTNRRVAQFCQEARSYDDPS